MGHVTLYTLYTNIYIYIYSLFEHMCFSTKCSINIYSIVHIQKYNILNNEIYARFVVSLLLYTIHILYGLLLQLLFAEMDRIAFFLHLRKSQTLINIYTHLLLCKLYTREQVYLFYIAFHLAGAQHFSGCIFYVLYMLIRLRHRRLVVFINKCDTVELHRVRETCTQI